MRRPRNRCRTVVRVFPNRGSRDHRGIGIGTRFEWFGLGFRQLGSGHSGTDDDRTEDSDADDDRTEDSADDESKADDQPKADD